MDDWEHIVRVHGPMAFAAAWRVLGNASDAEDVVQEALLDAFAAHARNDVLNWGGMLRRLATRRAIDRLRRRRVEHQLPERELAADGPIAAASERELAHRLRTAIGQLPDQEGLIFSLTYFGELEPREIAAELGISPHAASVALHKARTRLKVILNLQPLDDPQPRSSP